MITGFKNVNISDLNAEMLTKKKEAGKTDVELSAEIGVKSAATIANAFRAVQLVSDEVLTKVMKSIGVKGLVVWNEGERKYFISDK